MATPHAELPRGVRVHVGQHTTLDRLMFGPTSRTDGTENLIGDGADPTIPLYSTCKKLEEEGADIVAIPCNTAHAFVERIQQTILHEHWRIEFRRRYFSQLRQLEASLQSYLRFYNHQRAHHGYRTQGRTPAQIVWGAHDAND